MVVDNIPEDWKWRDLDDVCNIIMGNSPPGESYNNEGKGVPLLQGQNEFGDVTPKSERYTTEPSRLSEVGDVLVAVRATPLGIVNRSDDEYCLGRGVAGLRPQKELHETYLYYYMKYCKLKKYWEKVSTGSTYPSVTKTNLQKVSIPLPSLKEQEAIVGKFESVFERIDKATQAQRKSENIGEKIFQSCISSVMPETERVPFGEVTQSSFYGHTAKANEDIQGTPYLRITDINEDGSLSQTPPKKVEVNKDEYEKYKLEEGQMVVARSGATSGKSYLYNEEDGDMVYASYLIRFTLDTSKIIPEYAHYYFRSAEYWEWVSRTTRKSAQSNINAGEIKSLELPLPSLSEQREIVERLEFFEERIDDIREASEQMTAILDELPVATLHKGFQGELVNYTDSMQSAESSLPDGGGRTTLADFQ